MPSKKREERTWVEIDLDAIANNYAVARSFLREQTRMIAVVKANAYGNGAPQVARLLEGEPGVYGFGVASFEEGMRLRRAEITKPILILGYTPPGRAALLAANSLIATLTEGEYARCLSKAACDAGVTVRCHVKLDTGMNRLGVVGRPVERAVAEIEGMLALKGLQAEGIFTHFAASNWEDGDFTARQFETFTEVLGRLRAKGHALPLAHCCNSGGVVFHPECELDCVRSGFLLYGTQPDPDRPVPGLKNPMQLKSQVAQLKEVGPGDVVGYDCTYEVTRPMRIAVVPVGYADGLPFGLSNRGEMLVGGQRAPIVGKVCMDQTMIDVTHIDGVRRGDVVTVFGRDGGQELSVTEMAERAGVFAPGVFCNLNARVTRLFYLGGELVDSEVPMSRW